MKQANIDITTQLYNKYLDFSRALACKMWIQYKINTFANIEHEDFLSTNDECLWLYCLNLMTPNYLKNPETINKDFRSFYWFYFIDFLRKEKIMAIKTSNRYAREKHYSLNNIVKNNEDDDLEYIDCLEDDKNKYDDLFLTKHVLIKSLQHLATTYTRSKILQNITLLFAKYTVEGIKINKEILAENNLKPHQYYRFKKKIERDLKKRLETIQFN